MNHDYTLHLVEQGLIDAPLAALETAAALDQFQAELLNSLAADPPSDPQDTGAPIGPDQCRVEAIPDDQPADDFSDCPAGPGEPSRTITAVKAVSWGDRDGNPDWQDGCLPTLAHAAVIATALICLLWVR